MSQVDLLVTGARGFVGRHVIERASRQGRTVSASGVDLRDERAVAGELAQARPAAVIHLASAARTAGGDPWGVLGDELAMAGSLIRSLAEHAPGAVLLAAGSAAQYGMAAPEPLREDAPVAPLTAYAAVKSVVERAVCAAPLTDQVRTIWTRAFNHIGPGQGPDAPVVQWARQLVDAEPGGTTTVRAGRLETVRDYLDVRDVADAYLALVDAPAARGVVNVCSGIPVTMHELLARLIEVAGTPAEIAVDPALVREIDPPHVVGDPTRLRELTGWSPRVDLDASLAAVLEQERAAERIRA